jgi:hypothetical protein
MVYAYECLICPHTQASWSANCPACGGTISAVYESPETRQHEREVKAVMGGVRHRSTAQAFDPVVYHLSKDGRVSWPAHAHAPVRPGYERREARTLREMDQVVKRVNRQELDKAERHQHLEEVRIASSDAEHRPELRQKMQRMSPMGRRIAQIAMDRNDARRPRLNEPGVHLEVREFDRGNRDPYEDRRTGWRERRS